MEGLEDVPGKVYHAYDARVTRLGEDYYIMFAMDMDAGCSLGLARTRDFETCEFMGIVSEGDNRNGVLFPEKVGGKYLRLDRPNRVQTEGGPPTGNAIYLSESDDLLAWTPVREVMSGRWRYWDELIGAGPPPLKTREGWLLIYHGVATHFASVNLYQAGVALLDLENPGRVIGRSRYNILEPREPYELTGQVPNVVFPSGAVADETDGDGFVDPDTRITVYYGAADTHVCAAFTTVKDLLEAAGV
jgi:beta-1,4-mannooligosaccharide/beta-1,4-mannosyl-N-acetylglucosamine phosphorylase